MLSPNLSAIESTTVVIANLSPRVECGKFPTKRVVGERLRVEADIFKDGHDQVKAVVGWRNLDDGHPHEVEMLPLENDRWAAELSFTETGRYEISVSAWSDDFETWLHDFERRLAGEPEDLPIEVEQCRVILNRAALRAARMRASQDAEAIEAVTARLMQTDPAHALDLMASAGTRELLSRWPDRSLQTASDEKIELTVEPVRAQFSAWYEFFPRSATGCGERHGTFRDCLPRIEDARDMGFDIVYFPPIHPIGVTHRKGKNNTTTCEPGDVGSPWAIGAETGGHRSIEPALGNFEDFRWLVEESRARGIEIALDFAINCSPDHPYVRDHPEWFFQRPDGSIRYAENPPKKYQDIYPINFHCMEWETLWRELVDVVRFWIDQGVHIFRVDNPHTKPVSFWHYLIGEIHKDHPHVIFLSEAFTKPKMMQALAKVGFTQSYTYFTWRESKHELIEYVEELTQGPMREYFRGNFWPNTPDILPHHLQNQGPAIFKIRAALAALLSSSWGMYSGYEFCEGAPLPGREEYLDSEKYQIATRDWNAPGSIKGFITRLNELRQSQPALRQYANIAFVPADNDQILCFRKWSDDRENQILVVVNLDSHNRQESNVHLPLEAMGLSAEHEFSVSDLLHEVTYTWRDSTNFVSLDPHGKLVHVFLVSQGSGNSL